MAKIFDDEGYYIPGGPWDRGVMDSYYGRSWNPHYYVEENHNSERVEYENLKQEEIKAYQEGWAHNEAEGDFKDW